jgi:3-deoxy-D-manno-octulosonate 8-phosphate phosphatase (KDO 8-P phosphatase)
MQDVDERQATLSKIKALAIDVDGTLTDGGLWWGPAGEEMKRFSFVDIMGVSLLRRAGIILALISGEDSELVSRYAEKLLIKDVVRGCRDKASALRSFAEKHGLELSEICFMGDDVNDVPAMGIAGLAAVPANAHSEALAAAGFVSSKPGGQGAVRELADALLYARGMTCGEVFRTKQTTP